MSKKLAEGIDGLVLDVKTGTGAFMQKQEDAEELASNLIGIAKAFDKKVIAMITDMNQPLGQYIGNWLEVYESMKVLQDEKVEDLRELSLQLSGAMIHLGGKAESIAQGVDVAEEMISSGRAFDKFVEMVKLQDGDISVLHNPGSYEKTGYSEKIYSKNEGYLKSVNTYEIGMAALELGAGRKVKIDKIDPAAGIIFYPKIGDEIKKDRPVAEIFTNKKESLEQVKEQISAALTFSENEVKKEKLIKKIMK